MQGKIIKGIAGFYYVQTEDKLYECKAKGIFRNKKMKPLVGDNVEIDILDEEDQEGNITKIYERSNELIRPAVANVNQALIIFAAKNPKPNYNLLDRFLMMMEKQEVPVIVCFNKVDLAKEQDLTLLEKVYENCGHIVKFISVKEEEGIDEEALIKFLNEYDFLQKEKPEILQEAVKKKRIGLKERRTLLKRIMDKLHSIIELFNWE